VILYECGNAAARKPYRKDVDEFRRELRGFGDLIMPLPEDEESAWKAFGAGIAGEAGIVDHISFAVMRRMGIAEAFTNDHHYRSAGFVTLF
jgi:predicted nucleic acid-binding protein